MVLKKGKKENSTLFIDASQEFVKITNSNKLANANISRIIELFTDRKDVEYIAKLVGNDKISEQDYNLSVSTYVQQEDMAEVIDIVKLNSQIELIVEKATICGTK